MTILIKWNSIKWSFPVLSGQKNEFKSKKKFFKDDDCGDRSDEPDACNHGSNRFCPQDFFRCSDGSGCIPVLQLCDGSPECDDQSDENSTNCGIFNNNNHLVQSISSNSSSFLPNGNGQKCPGLFSCKNDVCVPWESLCNGQVREGEGIIFKKIS